MLKQSLNNKYCNYNSSEYEEYLSEAINNYEPLSKEVINDLFALYDINPEYVRNKIFKANMLLVVRIANKYYNDGLHDIFDLIQEGNYALMSAIENNKLIGNQNFTTYIYRIVRNHILTFINENNSCITVPDYVIRRTNIIEKYILSFQEINGRKPTHTELIEKYIVSENELIAYDMSHVDIISLEDIESNLAYSDINSSLETISLNNILKKELINVIDSLNISSKNLSIFKLYYGIDSFSSLKITEIASLYNLSSQRIFKIIDSITKRLKYNEKFQDLLVYIDEEPKRYVNPVDIIKKYKPAKTVYQQFSRYNHTDIDFVLQYIMYKDSYLKKLVLERYGHNFNEQNCSENCKLHNDLIYPYIYRYLCKLLESPLYFVVQTIEDIDVNKKNILDNILLDFNEEVQDIFKKLLEEDNTSLLQLLNDYKDSSDSVDFIVRGVLYTFYEKVNLLSTIKEDNIKVRK